MQKPTKTIPSEPVKEQFLTILQNGDKAAIIPFLKSLTKEERRKLVPIIKKYDDSWEDRRAAEDNIYVMQVAHFVCCTASEARKYPPWDFPRHEVIQEILEWYQPEWFSDFLNNDEVFYTPVYKNLVYWQHRGWIDPTPELIAKQLSHAILDYYPRTHYTTEVLEQYPVTLDEHIWYLFYYPSEIVSTNVNLSKASGKWPNGWCTTFKKYVDEGRLDRKHVLRESLQAVNRNFNKTLTGWFITLFLHLEPTPDELFELHEELLATLTCVWTKPVNTTLTLFKNMVKDKRFPVADFVQHLPALLSAEVKSIVTSALTIVETLLKQKTGNPEELCSAVCNAFLSKDEAVQKKAASIITRYAKPEGSIPEVLSSFSDNILMSVKPLLQAYLADNQPETESAETTATDNNPPSGYLPLIREDNRIPSPETFEDFAFSLSTLLDVKEDIHFDLLMDRIVTWAGRTDEENLILLESAFQKAYKRILNYSDIILSDMPTLLVINFYEYLQKKFPGKLENIAIIKQKAKNTEKKRNKEIYYYNKRLIPFDKLKVRENLLGYKIIAHVALKNMQQTDPLPLLSTPTHLPAWIDPVVLVTKLIQYQQRDETPDNMDLQLAVQRCALTDTREALTLANEQLTGELRNLILFLFGHHKLPQGEFAHPAWWMTAGITRSPGTDFKEFESFPYDKHMAGYFSDNIGWETLIEDYMAYGKYNPKKKDYDRYPAKRPALKLNVPEYKLRESDNAKDSDYLFLEYLMCIEYTEDADYQVTAIPNTPDAYYAYTADRVSRYGSSMWDVAKQQLALAAIKHMHELQTPLREMHYLLLVCCLTGTHKPTKDYALDIWTSRISAGTIDNVRLGTAIGKYLRFELVPLKRFTDLLSSSMTGISPRHNRAAIELVEAMMRQLNPEPIKNLKKLLENYKELLALNSAKADFEGIKQLDAWEKTDNLKKTVRELRIKK